MDPAAMDNCIYAVGWLAERLRALSRRIPTTMDTSSIALQIAHP